MKHELDPYIDMYSQVFGVEPAEQTESRLTPEEEKEYKMYKYEKFVFTKEEVKRYLWLIEKLNGISKSTN